MEELVAVLVAVGGVLVTVVLATAVVVVLEAAVKNSIQGIHMLFCQWSVYNVEANGMFPSKLVCISKKSMYSSSRTEREREWGWLGRELYVEEWLSLWPVLG